MKKYVKYFVLLTIIQLMFSCAAIKSVHYVGKKESVFNGYSKEISIWKYEKQVIYVKPIDDYIAITSTLEWDQSKKLFSASNAQILITNIGDHKFLNIKEDSLFTILKLAPSSDGQLVLFTINEEKIKKDIEESRIKIKDRKNFDYNLDLSKEELDNYISENINSLFDYTISGVVSPIIGLQKKDAKKK